MSAPRFDIVGIGVATVDLLALVDRFPAQEAVQQAHAMEMQGGGPVATALVAAARLGASAAMLDSVGGDWRGQQIVRHLAEEGVGVDAVAVHPGATSAVACVLVERGSGARTIIHRPGSAPELRPHELPRGLIERARILHMNGRHLQASLEAARWARDSGVGVSFDGGAHRYRPELREAVRLTDYCIVARDFAEQYTRAADLPAAAGALLAEGPSLAVITDGVRGSVVASRAGDLFHQRAFPVPRVVDTTGCGDSYHGAFLFGLLRGYPLRQTAALASAVAAINAQHLGGRAGLPSLEQARGFLRQQGEDAGFL
jgi:sugar/nucleoside kinase (ribokinase family)